MKKLMLQLAIAGVMIFGLSTVTAAQDAEGDSTQVEAAVEDSAATAEPVQEEPAEQPAEDTGSITTVETDDALRMTRLLVLQGGKRNPAGNKFTANLALLNQQESLDKIMKNKTIMSQKKKVKIITDMLNGL